MSRPIGAGPNLSAMATTRRASTTWKGPYSAGAGEVLLQSSHLGPFEVAPAVTAEGAAGSTSPMELLAAAHASCICGMVAYLVEKAGHPADMLETSAEVELGPGMALPASRSLSAVSSPVFPPMSSPP